MKIKAKLEVSENTRSVTFDFDDLGVTQQEWDELNDYAKEQLVKEAVFGLNDQPYWCLDRFTEQ